MRKKKSGLNIFCRIEFLIIDFMVHDTGLVFSEFTPYPMSGNGIINPAEFDEYLGGLWHLDGLNQKII
jgi:hypothetical protein